jgi:hypothetical protein
VEEREVDIGFVRLVRIGTIPLARDVEGPVGCQHDLVPEFSIHRARLREIGDDLAADAEARGEGAVVAVASEREVVREAPGVGLSASHEQPAIRQERAPVRRGTARPEVGCHEPGTAEARVRSTGRIVARNRETVRRRGRADCDDPAVRPEKKLLSHRAAGGGDLPSHAEGRVERAVESVPCQRKDAAEERARVAPGDGAPVGLYDDALDAAREVRPHLAPHAEGRIEAPIGATGGATGQDEGDGGGRQAERVRLGRRASG